VTDRPLVLGHRGANRRAPENTIAAFEAARAIGADGVELDVRCTADGALVVHHDPHVDGYGLLVAAPFAQLRGAVPSVPTLDEALDALSGLVVNIEVKCLPWEPDADPDGNVMRMVATTVQDRGLTEQVVVSSFDLGALGVLRSVDARIAAGWLTSRQPVEQTAPVAVQRGVGWLHPDIGSVRDDSTGAVALAHDHGLRIDVWTVNDVDDVRALAAAGVDAHLTDTPADALAALG
jgi:glycerophosphoryl diester phosphodiesterase